MTFLYFHLPFILMDIKLISFVLRAKNRRTILSMLVKERLTPSQIMKRTNMYDSHISRTIKELVQIGLVECENAEERTFRFYSATKLGCEVAKEVEKIRKEIST